MSATTLATIAAVVIILIFGFYIYEAMLPTIHHIEGAFPR